MIITRIRLQEQHPMASASDSWPLPSCDLDLDSSAGENGYLIKASDGLGPPDFTSIVQGFDTNGVPVYKAYSEKKILAFKVGLNPGFGQTYSGLRDNLYKFVERSLTISFMSGSLIIAQATGYISKFEVSHFASQPEILLTINCDQPYFTSPRAIGIPFVDLDKAHPLVNYEDGTAPTGMNLNFTVTGPHAGFSISNYGRLWYAGNTPVSNLFAVTYSFLAGDEITLVTDEGSQQITLTRAAVDYDLAGYLNKGAVWPVLFSGVNFFDWDITSAWATMVTATYIPKYWGV